MMMQGVDAKVTLTQYNKTYTSMPAMFGGLLSREEPPVLAHLVYMKDRPLMCSSSSLGSSSSGSVNATASGEQEQEQEQQSGNGNENDDDNSTIDNSTSTPTPTTNIQKIQTPSDGLPVAVLVERGSCTFWEKAEEASKLGDAVRYIVVYDNEMSPDLVPMSSEFPSNMTLFFVSMMSGHEIRDLILKKMISGYPYDPETSGLLVEIDGESPPLPPGYTDGPHLNLAAYFLAAMSGFLAFLVFFGCILIFAQCGWIIAHPDERGRIVLFGGGARPNFGGGAGRVETAKHLLTMEQVMSLEEIEYEADGGGVAKGGDDSTNDKNQENDHDDLGVDEEGSSCCCAICIDEFEDKEKARRLPCRHMFHEDCLIPWLTERHASCPMCKYDVLQHILDSEKDAGNGSKSNDQPDDMPTNSDTLEADSGAATEASTQSRSTPPHLLFWNRITFGGWSRVRNDSQSEEESDGQARRGGNNAREQEQRQRPSSSEIELENRSTMVEIMSTAAPSMTTPSHEEGP